MPRKKQSANVTHHTKSRKIWLVYSANRQYCFAEEIRGGFFGPNHRCGCTACDPQLTLPGPEFMPPPAEEVERPPLVRK